jgi:hypothetical protein
MKYTVSTLAFSALLAHASFGQAMVPGADNFSDGILVGNWGATPSSNMAATSQTFGGNPFVEFSNPTGASGFQYLNWLAQPNNLNDFSVSIGVSNFTTTANPGEFSNVGLEIYDASVDASGTDEYVSFYLSRYYFSSSFPSSVDTQAIGADTGGAAGGFAFASDFNASNFLLIDFVAADQNFLLSYDSGSGLMPLTSFNIDGNLGADVSTIFDWGMAPGDPFDLNLFGASNIAIATGSQLLNADNFTVTGIPEPGMLAPLLGLGAILAVFVRRRR